MSNIGDGWNDVEANKLPEKVEELEGKNEIPKDTKRKRVVVVGLGMVGIAFMCVLNRPVRPACCSYFGWQ